MYAIVDIAGKQFKVSKDQSIFAPSLEGKEGDKIEFDNVLLVDNKGKVNVGSPTIKGAKVFGKIIEHGNVDPLSPTLRRELDKKELLEFLRWHAAEDITTDEYRDENAIRHLIRRFRNERADR